MANINEILARAAALRDETALNSISPDRAGSIMYDTLIALNELWLQQGAALVISKIYTSVSAMEADTAPVSDLTGQPLRSGQIVVIASSDSDNGSVYRYNGTESPSWTLVGSIGNLEPVDSLDSDSTSLPLAAHQGKVLDGKISQLGQKAYDLENGMYQDLPISLILDKYPKNDGTLASLSGFSTGVFDVSKMSYIVIYNNNVNIANFSVLFSTDPTFNNITHGFALFDGPNTYTKFIIPDGALYAAVEITTSASAKVYIPYLSNVGANIISIGKINEVLPKDYSSALEIHTTVQGYPSTSAGALYPGTFWTTNIYDVSALNYVVLRHNCGNNVFGIALSQTTDLTLNRCVRMLTYNTTDGSTSEMFIDVRGINYIAVYSSIDLGIFDANSLDKSFFGSLIEIPQKVEEIDGRFVKSGDSALDSTIAGCYPRIDLQQLFEASALYFNTDVYDVTGVKFISITCHDVNTTYYGIAFSDDNETFDSTSVWKSYPGSGTYSGTFVVEVPSGKTFMAIDKKTTDEIVYYAHDAEILIKLQNNVRVLDRMFVSGFYGKKCIYIGDSISTNDNYHWKGYLRDKYNIPFVEASSGVVNPADGGIPVIPPITEPESAAGKSIWYRCAGARMGQFTFDFISLFGGTNDMNVNSESDISLGTVNDTPFVDTLTGFSEEKAAELTATRPATLTFAAALMGCIEMLHRDFPNKPIVLCTVMPCYGGTSYGNLVDANGVRMSERMAQLQMQIAARYNGDISAYASTCDYGVIAAPMYWNIRTYEGAKTNVLSKDGVHPNKACGKRMADFFAKVIDLR